MKTLTYERVVEDLPRRGTIPACMVPAQNHADRTPSSELEPVESRALNVAFLLTSMPVGGAETLLVNLMQRMNPARFCPLLVCLKELGPLGEQLATRFVARSGVLHHKYDLRVVPRLTKLFRTRCGNGFPVDAVVTVGAGDKMFWGRIAARMANTPVVLSALHSTGWPDGLGRLNRLLTPWTDAFIAVADEHGKFLVQHERLPASKVRVIPNGIDTDRFQFDPSSPFRLRAELGLPGHAKLIGIVAALRPEKNHELFLNVASRVAAKVDSCHFVIVGEGPRRAPLETEAQRLGISDRVHFLGNRQDVPQVLSALNCFLLTSQNEASPVSILESLAVQVPVVATDVGSVSATVRQGLTGFVAPPGDAAGLAHHVISLLSNPELSRRVGAAGREHVLAHGSLDRMVRGYEQLILEIYRRNRPRMTPPVEAVGDSIDLCTATP